MVRISGISAGIIVLALSACGSGKNESAAGGDTTLPASTSTTPLAFAPCMSCHAVKPGQNGIGPSLAGVFGRKAASAPGYEYSDAMKASGKVWDEATLDTYLTNPLGVVPGTRMIYMGQDDPAKRKAVIDYLKTLK